MFANFLSLCGDFAKTKLDPAAAYGGFSTQRNVAVSVGQGNFTSKRRFLCKDKYTALGDVEVALTAPVHDPRGYNTEIIAENGDIGPDLFAAKLRSAGGLPKDVLQLIHADIDRYIWDDSQISLLVSLMSTMYVLQAKELGVDKEQLSYDDGHVSFTLADQLCEQVQHSNWMVDEQIAVLNWDQVFHNEFSHANIMCTTGLAPKSIQILAAHMSGRNKTTGYSFDLQIPKLASVVMMTKTPPNDIDLSRVTSKDVKAALDSYVKMNRLEGAFEAAYAIYLQTAIRPVPDTAEGMAWLLRKRTLVLPAFSAHRGLYSVLLRDRPFGISSAVTTTLKLWRDVGLAFAVQGAMFTAVSLWGRYFVEAGFYHNDAEVERLGSYDFGTSPSAAYYCYATLVTGHDTYCPLPRNIGIQYDPWNSDTLMEYDVDVQDADITGYDIVVDGDRRALRVTEVPQPCSTVHVMGRMPNSGHFKCLSNNFKLHFARVEEGFEVANVATAWGVGLATRWLGFDTEMEYRGKSRIANWASNDTSMAARPFSVRGPDRKTVTIRGFLPRKKVYAQLPPVGYDEFDWDVTFHIDDAYTVSTLTKTRIMTRSSFYPPTQGDQKIIEVDYQNTMYTPVTLRVNSRANVEQTGFQVLPPQISHNPPDPIRPSAQEDEASGEEQEGDHG